MNKPIRSAMMKRDTGAFTKAVRGGVTSDFKYSDDAGKPMNFDSMEQMFTGRPATVTDAETIASKSWVEDCEDFSLSEYGRESTKLSGSVDRKPPSNSW